MEKVKLCEVQYYYKSMGDRSKKIRFSLMKVPDQFWTLDEDSQRHMAIGILGLDKDRLGSHMSFHEENAVFFEGQYYTESKYVHGMKE